MKKASVIIRDKRYAGLIVLFILLVVMLYVEYRYVALFSEGGVSYETFLGTIGQGLITVLAIIFALIMFPVQHASERFTVEMLKEFKKDLYTKCLFILISGVALFSLFLLGLYKNHVLFLTTVVFWSTLLCLFALYHFYHHVVELLDPRVLIHKISRRVLNALKTARTSNPDSPNVESVTSEFDIPEQVILKSIERNETDITRYTIAELYRLCSVISGKKKEALSERVFSRILSLYTRALLHALKYNNNSKYLLVYFVRDLIFLRPEKTPFNKEYLDMLMQYLHRANKIIIDFNDMDLFKEQLDYFSSLVDRDKIVERELYDVFFMIGAYALHSENREKFVKAIWTNIKESETPIKIVGQKNLVNFDIGFLFEQEVRLSESDKYIFDIFEGLQPYMTKYFILCLTYALHTLNYTWQITLPADDEQKKSLYILLSSLKDRSVEYKRQCDELKKEASKWSDIIKLKTIPREVHLVEETEPTKPSLMQIGAEEAFENTKKWINQMETEWGNKMQIILETLPLDSKRVNNCKREIARTYAECTVIPNIVNFRTYEEEKDKDLKFEFIGLRYLLDREWFTSPMTISEFSDIGRNIALGEKNYLVKQMIKVGEARFLEQISFEVLKSSINEFREAGYQPTSLFVPIDWGVELHSWWRTEGNKRRMVIEYVNGRPYLVIDLNTKLRIFWSSEAVKFEDFIIVDKGFGEWIVKPEDGNLLSVSIKESEKDRKKIELLVKTVFNFKVVNSKAVRILKIK